MVSSKSKIGLVSVIIPTRNRVRLLEKAIQSVQRQTYQHIEIIIVDDGSDQDCAQKVAELAIKNNCKLITNMVSAGGAAARNAGWSQAQGDYIAFLDDDDEWLPEKINVQLQMLTSDLSISAVSGWYNEESDKRTKLIKVEEINNVQLMLTDNYLGGASLYLIPKKYMEEVKGFTPSLRSGQDWDLLIRLYFKGKIAVVKRPIALYRAHDQIRITNVVSSYHGRRDIYFAYRHLMNNKTRGLVLGELIFYRIKLSDSLKFAHIQKFCKLRKILPLTCLMWFVFRFCKYYLKHNIQ